MYTRYTGTGTCTSRDLRLHEVPVGIPIHKNTERERRFPIIAGDVQHLAVKQARPTACSAHHTRADDFRRPDKASLKIVEHHVRQQCQVPTNRQN